MMAGLFDPFMPARSEASPVDVNRLSGVSAAESVPPQVSFWITPKAVRTLFSI